MNSPHSSAERRPLWLLGALLVLAAAVFVIGLGDAPIERAEIYFLDAARAMVETGDWLVPTYRGEPFYDKPPLTYWLMAFSFEVLGPSLIAGRLVAALLAIATLWATFLLTRRLLAVRGESRTRAKARDFSSDQGAEPQEYREYFKVWQRRAGGKDPLSARRDFHHGLLGRDPAEPNATGTAAAVFATAILGTSYAFVSFARLTMSDMLLTFLTLLAGGLFLLSETETEERRLVLCGALLGLGFLTKGPIAWIYFGALLLAVALVEKRPPRIFNGAGLLGTIAALGVGSSWFLLVYLREGIEPLRWFFLRENLQRFAAPTYDAAEPFWFYLPVYAIEGLPWSVLALSAILHAFRADSPRVLRVLFFWSMLMLVPLSLSRGKIDYYLLPLLPPLAILVGAYLASGPVTRGVLRTLAVVTGVLLLAAAFFPMLPGPFSPGPEVIRFMRAFLLIAAALSLWSAFRPRAVIVVSLSATAVLGTALFLFGAVVPAYRAAQPTEELLADIARERHFTPDLEVVVCDDTLRLQRDLLFSLRIPVVEHCELWAAVSSSRKFLIVATPNEERSLRTAENVRHIATEKLLPADVTRLGTLLQGARVSEVSLLANFETTDRVAIMKRNREFKRWLDTPEGQKAQAEYEARQKSR